MSEAPNQRMQRALTEGRASPLEAALFDWAVRHDGDTATAVALAACARAVAEGHSCLDLGSGLPALPGEPAFCDRATLEAALAASPLAGEPGEARPLILDRGRLYLHRYWQYESRLAARLRELLAATPAPVDPQPLLPDGGLFDHDWVTAGETHWQAVAAFVGLRHRLTVISGGPGTGKTYTVLRLIRLLVGTGLGSDRPAPLVRLAAPTGKAAARMVESMREGLDGLALSPTVRAHVPTEAITLHRLLGIGYGTTRPRHDRDDPIAADAVIVDEASMIDLPLMAKLLDALPERARLILLGDRYQLASVESGSVLAELCAAAGVNAFSPQQARAAAPLLAETPAVAASTLADHVVTLQTSHRFRADSPIGRLAAAVNAGDADSALAIAAAGEPGIELGAANDATGRRALIEDAAERHARLLDLTEPARFLDALRARRLLCAVRRGPAGSVDLNRAITERLATLAGFDPLAPWYHGRPVMVTRNDYRSGLYNGDVGICLRDDDSRLRVWFDAEGGLRAFLPSALPEHETVYAMTVHKSQGSEFEHVTLVLPDSDSPVLSRELVYTGITRARRSVHVAADEAVLRAAIARRIERQSGLADRLLD